MRFLAGPQVDHPDDVGIVGRSADEIQEARWIVLEDLAGLEQDLHDPLPLAGLRGESVEEHVGHDGTAFVGFSYSTVKSSWGRIPSPV
jgi:hypothetical protein